MGKKLKKKSKKDNKLHPATPAFGTEETAVRVIIRVRPFITREKKLKDTKCVTFEDQNVITITGDQAKKFTYDRVFQETCDQTEIFEAGPKTIVEKSLQGFNGCIFCYGQTGSGKTYTMYGDEDKKDGIIFKANDYIQSMIDDSDKTYKITATFIEIYNENLLDLLADMGGGGGQKLKIREDPQKGIYIEGVVKKEIQNSHDLKTIIEFGQQRRTVGSTEMNAVSSRSHSVLGLHIEQKNKNEAADDKTSEFLQMKSTLYMIDLAGSERAGESSKGPGKNNQISNKRLKEGTNINLSLTSLGMVIKALVDKSSHVPYRNSQLTRLLQDSLGGNSMTAMIANMSPATSNFADSLSTLQFANRAKNIKNKATKYKDPKQRRIAELLFEVEQLKLEIKKYQENCTCEANQQLDDVDRNVEENDAGCQCIIM